MITAQDAALQRARAYVRDRGWRHEPLTWGEVATLIEARVIDEDPSGCRQDAYDEGHGDGYDAGYADGHAEASRAEAS